MVVTAECRSGPWFDSAQNDENDYFMICCFNLKLLSPLSLGMERECLGNFILIINYEHNTRSKPHHSRSM